MVDGSVHKQFYENYARVERQNQGDEGPDGEEATWQNTQAIEDCTLTESLNVLRVSFGDVIISVVVSCCR